MEILDEIHADGVLAWAGTSMPYIKPIKADPGRRSRALIMTLEQHQEIDLILSALCASRLPRSAAKDVRVVRRVLRDRLDQECSSEEPARIYGRDCAAEVIGVRAGQIAAIDQVLSIMATVCGQRDALLVSLRRVRAWRVVSRARRGSRTQRPAA